MSFQPLAQWRRIRGIRQECISQIAGEHAESGQFLAHTVVQVLASTVTGEVVVVFTLAEVPRFRETNRK